MTPRQIVVCVLAFSLFACPAVSSRAQDRDELAKQLDELKKHLREERDRRKNELQRLEAKIEALTRAIDHTRKQDERERLTARIEALMRKAEDMNNDLRFPPPEKPRRATMEGAVREISGNQVRISIGADKGLKKGQKLMAYRLEPEPLYLGEISIESVTATESVGHFIPARRAEKLPKIGDTVSFDTANMDKK